MAFVSSDSLEAGWQNYRYIAQFYMFLGDLCDVLRWGVQNRGFEVLRYETQEEWWDSNGSGSWIPQKKIAELQSLISKFVEPVERSLTDIVRNNSAVGEDRAFLLDPSGSGAQWSTASYERVNEGAELGEGGDDGVTTSLLFRRYVHNPTEDDPGKLDPMPPGIAKGGDVLGPWIFEDIEKVLNYYSRCGIYDRLYTSGIISGFKQRVDGVIEDKGTGDADINPDPSGPEPRSTARQSLTLNTNTNILRDTRSWEYHRLYRFGVIKHATKATAVIVSDSRGDPESEIAVRNWDSQIGIGYPKTVNEVALAGVTYEVDLKDDKNLGYLNSNIDAQSAVAKSNQEADDTPPILYGEGSAEAYHSVIFENIIYRQYVTA